MILDNIILELESAARMAIPLRKPFIRALIPASTLGVYVILSTGRPVYVGRSDSCVRTRLESHARNGAGSHFLWQPTTSAIICLYLEAFLYHKYLPIYGIQNQIHPDVPCGKVTFCPFCK